MRRRSFRASLRLATALAAGLLLPLFAHAETPFEQDSTGTWWWLEGGRRFAIDPSAASVMLASDWSISDVLVAAASADPALAGLQVIRSNELGIHDLALPTGADPIQAVTVLAGLAGVRSAEPSAIGEWFGIPNDPQFGQQYHLHNTGQAGGKVDADIDAPEAWDIEDGDPSIVIAPIDSGYQLNHPDMTGVFWTNGGEIQGNGIDDDNNGFVDDNIGWDFGSNDNVPGPDYPHGSWVMGVIAARSNNTTGVAGVAGGATDGQGCKLMAISLGPSPTNTILDDAILYAAKNGARVITLSLGLPSAPAVDAALKYAADHNVFIDCSAGNGGSVSYPASSTYVMAVGGTDRFDGSGFFSQGPQVEVAAGSTQVYTTANSNTYAAVDGTSFSAPQVGGLAGLVLSLRPDLAAEQVRTLIRNNAEDVYTPGFDNFTGFGRINAHKTLIAAQSAIAAVVEVYGTGTAGGSGIPQISTNGVAPVIGASNFAVRVGSTKPLAPALFLLGSASAALSTNGGTLLVSPTPAMVIVGLTTSAQGNAQLAGPIPNAPPLLGTNAYFQWIITDVAAAGGFSFSNGLHITIGS